MSVVGHLLVATFYSDSHLRNRFSSKHSGQDVGGWRAGASIPSPVAGTVAGFGWHKNYGYWVSIRLASGWYVTFSHMLRATSLKRGAVVVVGTLVGMVGASGSFAVGFHVHVGYGPGMFPWSRPTFDPLPIIRKGTQPAAVIIKPIPNKRNPVAIIIQHIDNKRVALLGEDTFRELTSAQLAVERRVWGGTYLQVTSAEWNTLALGRPDAEPVTLTPAQIAAISSGVKVDLSTVLDAIRQVPTTVLNLIKGQWAK